MEAMTWPEIRYALQAGKTTAVLAVASTEQHGPALPLTTDEEIGRALAVEVALALGDALAAPVVAPGCSDHHLAWPGTVSIPPDLLAELVSHHLRNLAGHGFREIVLFSSHGGNFGPLGSRLQQLRAAAGSARLIDLLDPDWFFDAWFTVLRAHGRQEVTLPHADVMETAMMLYLRPELVRQDKLEPGFTGTVRLDELTARGLSAFTPNGVLGDPRGATAELGRALLEGLARAMVAEIRRRRQMPVVGPEGRPVA